MLHPSYTDLMAVVNSDVEPGEQPVVQSRYSIVLATAKRARQLISGHDPLVRAKGKEIKPLSVAVEELYNAKIKILNEDDTEEEDLEVTVSEEAEVISNEESTKVDDEGFEELSEADDENNSEEPSDEDNTEEDSAKDFEELSDRDVEEEAVKAEE